MWGVRFCFVLLLSLFVVLVLAVCDPKQKVDSTLTPLERMAQKENARVGQLLQNRGTADGGAINIMEIRNHPDGYTLNTGKTLKHAVVIVAVQPLARVREFVREEAYFTLIDANGKKHSAFDAWTQSDPTDEGGAEIILESEIDTSPYMYLVIGGYDPERNEGKRKNIFEIGD